MTDDTTLKFNPAPSEGRLNFDAGDVRITPAPQGDLLKRLRQGSAWANLSGYPTYGLFFDEAADALDERDARIAELEKYAPIPMLSCAHGWGVPCLECQKDLTRMVNVAKARIAELEDKYQEDTAEIANLSGRLDAAKVRIAELETRIEALTGAAQAGEEYARYKIQDFTGCQRCREVPSPAPSPFPHGPDCPFAVLYAPAAGDGGEKVEGQAP